MIREAKETDFDEIMKIWLDTNIQTHNFVDCHYWEDNYKLVEKMLAQAKLYVYEDDSRILGFIGLEDNYIAGLFVKNIAQSRGIGKKLLDYVKNLNDELTLHVYQENRRAVDFYLRENFEIKLEDVELDTNRKEYLMVYYNKKEFFY